MSGDRMGREVRRMVILWVTTAWSMSPANVSRRPLVGTIFAQSFLGGS